MKNNEIYTLMPLFLAIAAAVLLSVNNLEEGNFSGAVTVLDLAPKGFTFQMPEDISAEAAGNALAKAEKDLQEMKELGFITIFTSDALKEAKDAYSEKNYLSVFKLAQLIAYVKERKVEFLDRVKLLEIKKQTLQEKGITDFSQVNSLMQQAMSAFSLDQLDEADAYLKEAGAEADKLNREYMRISFLTNLSRNFFVRYWWQISAVLIILGVSTPFIFKKVRRSLWKRKLSNLRLELLKTNELIKKLQKECFIDGLITTKVYQERAEKYADRITEIKQKMPLIEALLAGRTVSPKKEEKQTASLKI